MRILIDTGLGVDILLGIVILMMIIGASITDKEDRR